MMLAPHGRRPLLARALHGARRERGAHPARRASAWRASPARVGSESNEWESTLVAAGCADELPREARRGRRPEAVVDFLVRDPDNPSSILSCLETARRNARAVRTALTVDMWETLNDTWLELRSLRELRGRCDRSASAPARVGEAPLAALQRRLRQHHAAQRRLLLHAARHLPRARRQHRAHPRREVPRAAARRTRASAAPLDYCQWESILRAVSALRALPLGLPRRGSSPG